MQKFMTKAQFNDSHEVHKDVTDGIARVQVYDKATDEMVYSSASIRSMEQVLNEMYFQLNVVNYVNVNN